MANIFADGKKILTDDDVKIKIIKNAQNDFVKNKFSDIFPVNADKGILILGIDGNNKPALTSGFYSPYLAFGENDVRGIISVSFNSHTARITGGNLGSSWSENIAWQSDIETLKARITALEKQIGGVLSSLLNHLKSRIEVIA